MSQPSSELPKALPRNLQQRLAQIAESGLEVTVHWFKNKRQAITLALDTPQANDWQPLVAYGNIPHWEFVTRETFQKEA